MLIGIFVFLYSFGLMVNGYPSNENQCSNQGIYLRLNNSPQCYCLPEWEGEHCDSPRQYTKQIDPKQISRISSRNTPCTYLPDLCKNSGVCYLDGNSKLACQCPYPFDGTRCQEYSVCYNYCFNGGICKVTGTDPKDKEAECECDAGFEGTRCQFIVTTTVGTTTTTTTTTDSTTTDVICSFLPDDYCNAGVCVVSNNRAMCQCPSTHTGDQCQFATGVTQSPGVTNRPVIIPGQSTPFIPGQTNPPIIPGQTNSPPVGGSCAQNPCRYSRPCYNNGNSYYCYCGSQYSGFNCEIINQG